jgi:hypothetical protein
LTPTEDNAGETSTAWQKATILCIRQVEDLLGPVAVIILIMLEIWRFLGHNISLCFMGESEGAEPNLKCLSLVLLRVMLDVGNQG